MSRYPTNHIRGFSPGTVFVLKRLGGRLTLEYNVFVVYLGDDNFLLSNGKVRHSETFSHIINDELDHDEAFVVNE